MGLAQIRLDRLRHEMGLQGGGEVYPSTLDVPEDVHICLSTDKTCALKVKRINYPAEGPSRKCKKPINPYPGTYSTVALLYRVRYIRVNR